MIPTTTLRARRRNEVRLSKMFLSIIFSRHSPPLAGKKRKAKEGKKSGKKKKKRKFADSDASEPEFEASGTVASEETSEDYHPPSSKRGGKRGGRKTAESSPPTSVPATPGAADEKPTVEEVCDNFGLNDVDLDHTDADYHNLTTYKLFLSTYRQRIQAANPKVRGNVTDSSSAQS